MKDLEDIVAKDAKVEIQYNDGRVYVKTVTLLAKIDNPLTEDNNWLTRPLLAMLPYCENSEDGKNMRRYTKSIAGMEWDFIKKYQILETY
ncbi:hypothetical protein NHG25_05910 [Aerococcaceae bacterium NML191292]|nr:hypothetical protein [Aerococcaceae bacterium NML191292]